MLAPDVVESIAACAREFDAGTIWLFGSSLDDEAEARDIDLAVEGLAPEKFFKFHFQLMLARGWRIAKNESWHKDLLREAFKQDLLTEIEFTTFGELLSFQHLHIHGYGHMLEGSRVRALAIRVPPLVRTYLAGKEFEDGQPT